MIRRANSTIRRLKRLHQDERGADMVEYILLIAAVALPLLAVIIWFWKDISDWAGSLWEDAKGSAEEGMPR
ncbi:MAG: Flp family type IVb pilin [Phycisphaerae bacterium]